MMHSNSKERGMIFNSEMVRAILSGQKTQTRRIVKCDFQEIAGRDDGSMWPWREDCEHAEDYWYPCHFGNVGDRIWVRETHHLDQYGYTYKADGDWIKDMRENGAFGCDEKWTPSMHMKRCASRILLEITNVRVERLNDISEEDAIAEGCRGGHDSIPGYMYNATPHEHFHYVWGSICGDENWEKNPWVWCISFKRVQEQSND